MYSHSAIKKPGLFTPPPQLHSVSKQKSAKIIAERTKDGSYVINCDDFTCTSDIIFNKKVVGTVTRKSKGLIFKSDIDGDIHLKNKLDVENLFVKVKVGIYFDGSLRVRSGLKVRASSVHFSQSVKCSKQADIKAAEEITLAGKFLAKGINFCTKKYEQNSSSSVKANAITIHAKQGLIASGLSIRKALLVFNKLTFGNKLTPANIKISDYFTFKTVDFNVIGNTTIHLANSHKTKASNFTVQQKMETSLETSFNCKRVDININKLISGGSWHLEKTQFTVSHLTKANGSLGLNESVCDGEQWLFKNSHLQIKNHSLIDAERTKKVNVLYLGKQSSLKVNNSQIQFGDVLSCAKSEIISSKLFVENDLILKTNVKLLNSEFQSRNIQIEAQGVSENIRIAARKLYVNSESLQASQWVSRLERMKVVGGKRPNSVTFNESEFLLKTFCQQKHVSFVDSKVIGLGNELTMHEVDAGLTLKRSIFASKSQIHTESNGEISVIESSLSASLFKKDLTLKSNKSKFSFNELLQKSGDFSIKKSVASVKNKAVFLSGETVLRGSYLNIGKGYLDEGASISSQGFTTTNKNGKKTTHGGIVANKMHATDNSRIESKNAPITLNKFNGFGELKLKNAEIKAKKDINLFGNIKSNNSRIKSSSEVFQSRQSKGEAKGMFELNARNLVIRGHIAPSNNRSNAAKDDKTNLDLIRFKAKKGCKITPSATIKSNHLDIAADSIDFEGKVEVSNSIKAEGISIYNSGRLFAGDSISLLADVNVHNASGGEISSKSVNIASLSVFNCLASIKAKQHLSISSIFNVSSLGFIAANNYTDNSIISTGAGITLPNFSGDIDPVNLLKTVGMTGLGIVCPKAAAAVNFALMLRNLYHTGKTVKDLIDKCEDPTHEIRLHEIVTGVTSIYSCARSAHDVYKTGSHLYKNKSEPFTELEIFADLKTLKSRIKDINFSEINKLNVGMQLAQPFLGIHQHNNLFDFNVGLEIAPHLNKRSALHVNTGLELGMLSHSVNSVLTSNSGAIFAPKLNVISKNINNSGKIFSPHELTIKAKYISNHHGGKINGQNNCHIDADILIQDGEFSLKNGTGRIGKVLGADDSKTNLKNMMLIGDDFYSAGSSNFSNVKFIYKKSYHMSDSSSVNMNNVEIESPDVSIKGKLGYENVFAINAQHCNLDKNLTIVGKKSEENNDDTMELQVPQHILMINGSKVSIDAEMKGGDYTVIAGDKDGGGNSKVHELKIGDNANIALTNGCIKAEKAEISGNATLGQFDIELNKGQIAESAQVILNNGQLSGSTLDVHGQFETVEQYVEIDKLTLHSNSANKITESLWKVNCFEDHSSLTYQGQCQIKAEKYYHDGFISVGNSSGDNYFSLKTKTATLNGGGNFDNAKFYFTHGSDLKSFVCGDGEYANYNITESLASEFDGVLSIDKQINRDCDVGIIADSITLASDYDQNQRLELYSKTGDIYLNGNVVSKSLYVQSAAGITSNQSLYTYEDLVFDAAGRYCNAGGEINGENVDITASEILNLTEGSGWVKDNNVMNLGSSGVIQGRQYTFLTATEGNIENHGGTISSGHLTQLVANGDVLNVCNEYSYQGKHDIVKEYRPGIISGGDGGGNDGVGLHIKAEGKVIADGSWFVSSGDNYFDAKKGVEFSERHHTYIENDKTKRSWGGAKKKRTIETNTIVQTCMVGSINGKNIISSEAGGVDSKATQFSSKKGTEFYTEKEVHLFDLKTQDKKITKKSLLFGLSSKKREAIIQSATPTHFIDEGKTILHSRSGYIDCSGALFSGSGGLNISTPKYVKFSRPILKHSIHERSRGFGINVPGKAAYDVLSNNGSVWDAALAEESLLSSMNGLYNSHSTLEYAVNGASFTIDGFNALNNIASGINNSNLANELMARYGLGDSDGFAPKFSMSYFKTDIKMDFETLGDGGVIEGGPINIEAREAVILKNGATIHGDQKVNINTPQIIATSAVLDATTKEKKEQVDIGINTRGQFCDIGASMSKTTTTTVTHVNSTISSNEYVNIHNNGEKCEILVLNGANIVSPVINLKTKKLEITDVQNEATLKASSYGLNSMGTLHMSQSKGSEKVCDRQSGLHIMNNEDGVGTSKIEVDQLLMNGGELESENEFQLDCKEVIANPVHDTKNQLGYSASFNVNNFLNIKNASANKYVPGASSIPTINVSYNRSKYVAEKIPIITHDKIPQINKEIQLGHIATSKNTNVVVRKDKQTDLNLKIPLTNSKSLSEAYKNIARTLGGSTPKNISHANKNEKHESLINSEIILDIDDDNDSEFLMSSLESIKTVFDEFEDDSLFTVGSSIMDVAILFEAFSKYYNEEVEKNNKDAFKVAMSKTVSYYAISNLELWPMLLSKVPVPVIIAINLVTTAYKSGKYYNENKEAVDAKYNDTLALQDELLFVNGFYDADDADSVAITHGMLKIAGFFAKQYDDSAEFAIEQWDEYGVNAKLATQCAAAKQYNAIIQLQNPDCSLLQANMALETLTDNKFMEYYGQISLIKSLCNVASYSVGLLSYMIEKTTTAILTIPDTVPTKDFKNKVYKDQHSLDVLSDGKATGREVLQALSELEDNHIYSRETMPNVLFWSKEIITKPFTSAKSYIENEAPGSFVDTENKVGCYDKMTL